MNWQVPARVFVLTAGAVGLLLFGASWTVLKVQPKRVEATALDFMRAEIVAEAQERLRTRVPPTLARAVAAVQARLGKSAAGYDELLEGAAAEQIAAVVARLCSCGVSPEATRVTEGAVAASLRKAWQASAGDLRTAASGLTDFITERYQARRDRLLRELRFFTGSNAGLFFAIFLAAALRPRRSRALLVPTVLLSVSTVVSCYLYLFQQDWFHTLVFESYVGDAYLVYVGLIFGTLMDVALNKARVTEAVVNAIASTPPIPC